jgi:hypothetical protein
VAPIPDLLLTSTYSLIQYFPSGIDLCLVMPHSGVSFTDAYRDDIVPCTMSTVEALYIRVSALLRGSKNFWVGLTSNGTEGLVNRWNSKYKALGMTNIAWIYRTSSSRLAGRMEAEIIDFYKEHADNERAGNGGNNGTHAPFVVYLAWKQIDVF